MSLDMATCPRCYGAGARAPHVFAARHGGPPAPPCPDCDGTGQRHTVTECDECAVAMLVPWSVDHTLAPLRCDACKAVCNETAARVAAGRR